MPLSRLFIKIIISFLQRKVNVLYSNSVLEYDKRVTVLHSGVVILYATASGFAARILPFSYEKCDSVT